MLAYKTCKGWTILNPTQNRKRKNTSPIMEFHCMNTLTPHKTVFSCHACINFGAHKWFKVNILLFAMQLATVPSLVVWSKRCTTTLNSVATYATPFGRECLYSYIHIYIYIWSLISIQLLLYCELSSHGFF